MKFSKHLKNILVIIVIAGALGGIGNYYMLPQEAKGFTLLRSVILGIIAAGVLPLFLKLISSSLLNTDGLSLPYKNYIILISFCLLTGVFADLFLQGMYRKVFHEFETVIKSQNRELKENNIKSKILLHRIQYQANKINTNKQQLKMMPKSYALYHATKKNELAQIKKSYKLNSEEAKLYQNILKSSIVIKNKNSLTSNERKNLKVLSQKRLIETKEFDKELWIYLK